MTKLANTRNLLKNIRSGFLSYWRANWWHKAWLIIILIILLTVGAAYGVAAWYKSTQPAQIPAATFVPDYARYLGLDPQKTLSALGDIGVKHFRLVGYWSDIESTKGSYDFTDLDWQFAYAEKHHAKISLSIGLRQPRWPECHAPDWVDIKKPASDWQPALEKFMAAVINRYKNSPALESYQLENEFFNKFGDCYDSSRERLVSEYNLVKKLDPTHKVIITRSNKYPNMPTGQPRPDVFGEEIYHKVWWPPGNRYFTYPIPSWYYSFLAGATKIATGRDSILTEVQAEPWLKPGESLFTTSLKQQDETFSADIFKQNIKLAEDSGLKIAYYWGASYWYYRWQVQGDKSVWNVARDLFSPTSN